MTVLHLTTSALRQAILGGLFPRYCGLCGLAADGAAICPPCLADLPRIERPCMRCGAPRPPGTADGIECGSCQSQPPAFDRAHAPLAYRWPVDRVIKALKFANRQELAPMLAEIICPWLGRHASEFDALVPVPLHRWRHAARGFNQADEIARELGRRSRLPIERRVIRCRRTRPQPGLQPGERRKNLEDAFRVRGRLRYRRLLIIDDVITTGATSNELARTLKAAGAQTVGVLAVARTSHPRIG